MPTTAKSTESDESATADSALGDLGDASVTAPSASTSDLPATADTPTASEQTCAFCGETAVFEGHTEVGGRFTLDYHGCPQSAEKVQEYFIATVNDPSIDPPTFVTQ